jgi:hypothetical protein
MRVTSLFQFVDRWSAFSTIFPSVLAVVSPVLAPVVTTVYAVGDNGRCAHHCRGAGDGRADDAPTGGAGWS